MGYGQMFIGWMIGWSVVAVVFAVAVDCCFQLELLSRFTIAAVGVVIFIDVFQA